jgi:hypothetical protein
MRRLAAAIIVILFAIAVPLSLVEDLSQGSGPISTFPASWVNVCGGPVHGDTTTINELAATISPNVSNVSLSQVYSRIVNSLAFRLKTFGYGWVTASWDVGGQLSTAPGVHIVVTFVRTFLGHPDGFLIADYNTVTGLEDVDYQAGLMSYGCPPEYQWASGTITLA